MKTNPKSEIRNPKTEAGFRRPAAFHHWPRLLALLALSSTLPLPAQAPTNGLTLWLKSDAGVTTNETGRVTEWRDQSPAARTLTQGNVTLQPLWVAEGAGGLPAVRFARAYLESGWVAGWMLTASNAVTIFTVERPDVLPPPGQGTGAVLAWRADGYTPAFGLNTGRALSCYHGSGSAPSFSTPTPAGWHGAWHVVCARRDGAEGRLWVNGLNVATGSGFTTTVDVGKYGPLRIGNERLPSTAYFAGDLAEVLVYGRALSEAERVEVEGYLRSKYGLTPGTVAAPDLLVKGAEEPDTAWAGGGLLQTEPGGEQVRTQSVAGLGTAAFTVKVVNRAGEAGRCVVLGAHDAMEGWTSRWEVGGQDVTAAALGTSGYVTDELAPGAAVEVRVELARTNDTAGTTGRVRVNVRDGYFATVRDAVRLVGALTAGGRADLWVRAEGETGYLGAGVINDDGTGQTSQADVGPRGVAQYEVRLVNTGLGAGRFRVRGTGGGGDWQVRYWAGAGSGGAWTEVAATNPPPARYGHTLVGIGDRAYLFGGWVESGGAAGGHSPKGIEPQNDLWVFNDENLQWAEITAPAPKPSARTGHAAVASGGKMYLFGGANSAGVTLGDLWLFNSEALNWTEITSPDPPPPRKLHKMTVVSDELVVVGGLDANDNPLNDMWFHSPSTGTWRRVQPPPAGDLYDFVLCAPSGDEVSPWNGLYIYTSGKRTGRGPKDGGGTMYVYDLAHDTWRALSVDPIPAPRLSAAVASSPERAWVFGGAAEPAGTPLRDAWSFDFATEQWRPEPYLAEPLVNGAAAHLSPSGRVVVFGGQDADWRPHNRTQLLPPDPLAGGVGEEITAAVTGEGWTNAVLAPGASQDVVVEVRPGPTVPLGSACEVWVRATLADTNAASDAVKLVTTLVLRLEALGVNDVGAFGLALFAQPDLDYQVQVSTNLSDWTSWQVVHPVTNRVELWDPAPAALPARFYRARLWP